MKTTALVLALMCGCIGSACSQINQNNKRDASAHGVSIPYYNTSPVNYAKMFAPLEYNKKIGGPFFLNDRTWFSSLNRLHYKMPCVEPQGLFSMKAMKPDTTINYTMLIKR